MTTDFHIISALRGRLRKLRRLYPDLDIIPADFVKKFERIQPAISQTGSMCGFYWIDETKPKTIGNIAWSAELRDRIHAELAAQRKAVEREKYRLRRIALRAARGPRAKCDRQVKAIVKPKAEPKPHVKPRKPICPKGAITIDQWINELRSAQNQ